jgi:MFS family permease
MEAITPQSLQTLMGVRAGAGLGGGMSWPAAAAALRCCVLALVFRGAAGSGLASGSAAAEVVAGVAASGVVAVDGGALVWPQDWSAAAPTSRLAHSAGILKRLDDKGMIVTLTKFGTWMRNLPQ